MPTPKPGQILCPTCHRATPLAAFCTQCGTALPPSAHARPRGMDRDELEERIRTRRPGERGVRRGTPLGDEERRVGATGYVPFAPEPDDARAVREEEPAEAAPSVDHTSPGFDTSREAQSYQPASAAEPAQWTPQAAEPAFAAAPPSEAAYDEAAYDEAAYDEVPYDQAAWEPGPDEDAAYGTPDGAYPPGYRGSERPRGGGGALPIIGFILLCVLALGVGAALASALGGGIGQSTTTPSASPSLVATTEPTLEPTAEPSGQASATPRSTDGPVTFPDGAQLSIQPCGSSEFEDDAVGNPEADACTVDSSSIEEGEVWAVIVFADTAGSDSLTVRLVENDQVLNEQEVTIDAVLGDCGSSCNGLIYGAHYVGLFPGDYQLILRRGEDFADSATFTVEG